MNSTREGLEWKVIKKNFTGTVPSIPKDLLKGKDESPFKSKFSKVLSNPFVPLGLIATCGCLIGMFNATKNRNPMKAQKFMKGRIAAQAFTIVSLVTAGLHSVNWDTSVFFISPKKVVKPLEINESKNPV